MEVLPQAKAAAAGIDQDLAAVGRGLLGVGQLEVESGLTFGISQRGNNITIMVLLYQHLFHLLMLFAALG